LIQDANTVEAALLLNEKKFPPMLPRKLRVTRAKKPTKKPSKDSSRNSKVVSKGDTSYRAKPSSQSQSLAGRAAKLLGKAGGSRFTHPERAPGRDSRDDGAKRQKTQILAPGVMKTPESIVFEGYRASSNSKVTGFKTGGKGGGKKKGKPRTRSTARASAWKSGGKK
jgi:nucleolar protein 12